jgi:uncharacterized protein YjeT (DUF2065 family)
MIMLAALFYIAWAIAVALVAVGLYAMVAPHALARHYGVTAQTPDAGAFVRATGIRDVALGIALAATAYLRLLPLLAVLSVAGIGVSVVDFWIASHHASHHETRRRHAAHAIHASGIVAFVLVLAMALFSIGR